MLGAARTAPVLMDIVWSDARETFDRTVDINIKTLRAKLRARSTRSSPLTRIVEWDTA